MTDRSDMTVKCATCGKPMIDRGAETQWCSRACHDQKPMTDRHDTTARELYDAIAKGAKPIPAIAQALRDERKRALDDKHDEQCECKCESRRK